MSSTRKYDFLIADVARNAQRREQINHLYHAEEDGLVRKLLESVALDAETSGRVNQTARDFISGVRERKNEQGVLEAFMQEYDLSSEEGVVLMCLAEALLRIPDDETAEKLIAIQIMLQPSPSQRGFPHSPDTDYGQNGLKVICQPF